MQTAPAPTRGGCAHSAAGPARDHTGQLDRAQLLNLSTTPDLLRSDPWIIQYLDCVERSGAGRPLGGGARTAWLKRQRHAYATGSLPQWRADLLERLDGFTWTPDADRWLSTFDRVQAFTADTGRIPTRGDDPALAAWLADQRLSLRRGKLDPRRAAALDTLPGWQASLTTPRAAGHWEEHLERLGRFRARTGRYPDARSEDAAEAELGGWANRQRECHQRSDLSPRRAEALEALPDWRWSVRDATFDHRVFELARELRGGPIPTRHRHYNWVITQRRRHREGRLSAGQSAALDSLGLLGEALARGRDAA